MKPASAKEIKTELTHRSTQELMTLVLRLSRFKKENKELLSYLLFESEDEEAYIQAIKTEIDLQFKAINSKSLFYIKKSVRKILREIKKHIRYSLKKETEVELLLYYCQKLKNFTPSLLRNNTLKILYERQLEIIKKKISTLHEDLQYDYMNTLEAL